MSLANLATALVKAQGDAQAVAKASTNSYMKYKYASAESLIEEGRVSLSTAGLALLTLRWELLPPISEACSSLMKVYYLLIHTSGECLSLEAETSVIPEKGRPQDKAEATALTYNLGYFLRGLLLLPREEEGASADSRDDRERGDRRSPTREESRPGPAKAAPTQAPGSAAFDAGVIATADGLLDAIEVAKSAGELAAIASRATAIGVKGDALMQVRQAWAKRKEQLGKEAA